jgi:hypothetical protein
VAETLPRTMDFKGVARLLSVAQENSPADLGRKQKIKSTHNNQLHFSTFSQLEYIGF